MLRASEVVPQPGRRREEDELAGVQAGEHLVEVGEAGGEP
jgi:hypothetical protein